MKNRAIHGSNPLASPLFRWGAYAYWGKAWPLVLGVLLFSPFLCLMLLIKNGTWQQEETCFSVAYLGSWQWILFESFVCFPLGIALFLRRGFQWVEGKPSLGAVSRIRHSVHGKAPLFRWGDTLMYRRNQWFLYVCWISLGGLSLESLILCIIRGIDDHNIWSYYVPFNFYYIILLLILIICLCIRNLAWRWGTSLFFLTYHGSWNEFEKIVKKFFFDETDLSKENGTVAEKNPDKSSSLHKLIKDLYEDRSLNNFQELLKEMTSTETDLSKENGTVAEKNPDGSSFLHEMIKELYKGIKIVEKKNSGGLRSSIQRKSVER